MEEALQLLKKIEAHGLKAYLIGGFPRDYYLGKTTTDFDICTNGTEEILKSFLTIERSQFGSMVISYLGKEYQITTFRKEETYQNHRYPASITYVDTLEEDLLRRDFIMNTLAIDAQGVYVDLLGARADLDQRIIRTVGDPIEKLKEDALRILRALRFSLQLDFEIVPELKEAILLTKEEVMFLTESQIRKEVEKMLALDSEKTVALFREYQMDFIFTRCTAII